MAAAQPPHEALDVEALGASVATHETPWSKGFWDWRQPSPQTLMTLYGNRPHMLCAKRFVLFVLGREGGGVRDNYTR